MDSVTAAVLIGSYGSMAVLGARAVLRAELTRRRAALRGRMPGGLAAGSAETPR